MIAQDPAILPDGRIVYSTNLSKSGTIELWMIDSETKEKERLTRYDEGHGNESSFRPAVLSDGRIIFLSDLRKKDKFDLYILEPND